MSKNEYNTYESYSEYYEDNELNEENDLEDIHGISLSKTKRTLDEDYDLYCHKEINKIGEEENTVGPHVNIKPSEPIGEALIEDEENNGASNSHFAGPDFRIPEIIQKENKDVIKYQKTGDLSILEQLYVDRIPTLNYWANKNKHIDNYNTKDIRGQLTKTFLKVVDGYKHKKRVVVDGETKVLKRNFNAYLFQSFKNDIINICTKKKAKKRTPYCSDENQAYVKLLSLDYSYSCNNSSNKINLKDTIKDNRSKDAIDNIILKEMISILSADEPEYVRDFFVGVSMGKKPSVLLREYKTVRSEIEVEPDIAKRISKSRRPCTTIVGNLLKEHIEKRFKLISYSIEGNTLSYTIELHKTKETDDIGRKIRKIRKNKSIYLSRIGLSHIITEN